MPDRRIDMPNGMTLRSASKRRYIVVVYVGAMAKWVTDYRTDKESNALACWREWCRKGSTANVIDLTTGDIIR